MVVSHTNLSEVTFNGVQKSAAQLACLFSLLLKLTRVVLIEVDSVVMLTTS
jgi:hypothetical protein